MTLGQRIAQKRKEFGLSQEALGEQLGVSRQAIYKWESDTSLPEIEKLIALSRIFSVTVGWLLGTEEACPAQGQELTPGQLAMVREITQGYLDARPGLSPRRKKQLKAGLVAGGICLAGVLLALAIQLGQITHQYHLLQQSVGNINQNVQQQINSITSRVEEAVKEQYQLTADWSCEYSSTDPTSETATFQVRVVPKHYTQGATALFLAQGDGKTLKTPVELGEDHTFSAQVQAPLSNEITLSLVMLEGEAHTVQQLDTYHDLYDHSFPVLAIHRASLTYVQDGLLPAGEDKLYYSLLDNRAYFPDPTGCLSFQEEDLSLQLGIFRDGELLVWYREEERQMTTSSGTVYTQRGWFAPQDIILEPGHEYCEAILLTDPWGRQRLYSGTPYTYDADKESWTWDSSYRAPGPLPTGLDYPLSQDGESHDYFLGEA